MSDKKIEDLEKRLNAIEQKMKENPGKDIKTNTPTKRKPSGYNLFMSEELTKLRKENKDLPMKEAWSMAIKTWNEKKEKK